MKIFFVESSVRTKALKVLSTYAVSEVFTTGVTGIVVDEPTLPEMSLPP